jgi:hypothetical protein
MAHGAADGRFLPRRCQRFGGGFSLPLRLAARFFHVVAVRLPMTTLASPNKM